MTKTSTKTFTKTFTRIDVLAFQINYIVECTTNSESFQRIVEKGIKNKQIIEVININGVDGDGNIHAQIIIRVDWERHNLHIKAGNNIIQINEDCIEKDNLTVPIGKIVNFFNELVSGLGLKASWTVRYRAGVNHEEADKELGLTTCSPQKWADGELRHVIGHILSKLDEFSIDLSAVIPRGTPEDKMKKKKGTVKWFHQTRGYGFIAPDDGLEKIFVHYSQIHGSGFRTLKEGQIVEFEIEKHQKGFRAVNVEILE